MANTVTSLNYANTFADWLVATDALILENNVLGKGDYRKNSGTLFLDGSLQSNGVSTFQSQILSQGVGSSVTIDNNTTIKYGTLYIKSLDSGTSNIALVARGQANVDGLLFANGSGTGLYVLNNTSVDGNAVIRFNTSTNRLQANTAVVTGVLQANTHVFTNRLQSNTAVVTGVVQANTLVVTDYLQANSTVNTTTAIISDTTTTKFLSATTSSNTETSFANVAYAHYLTANNLLTAPTANITSSLIAQTSTINDLQVNNQLTVAGDFVLTGDTIYDANVFTINAGSNIGLNSSYVVNRGSSGSNSAIRWNEPSLQWEATRGGDYYRILTNEHLIDNLNSTSAANVATANAAYTAGKWATSAGSYANSAFIQANSAFAAANNVGPQVAPAFAQANSAYARANTSANVFVGTTGSVAHSGGVISLSSNNGVTVVATSANNFAISTPQDLRTSASPLFASLTLTAPLAVAQGGTGATTTTQAITNLLPTGTTAGYVLTTGGPGNFYWAAGGGGGGGGATPGTTISSSRLSYTANGAAGYTGNSFTIPAATATNQVRAYIDGVRQFESEYSLNLNANTITFTTAPDNGNKVLIEVDGYYVNPYYANNISFTAPFGDIVSSANTIQLAIQDIETRKAALTGAAFTGVATGVTVAAGTSNTAFATTAYVQNLANNSGTLVTNITGGAGYANTVAASVITGTIGATTMSNTIVYGIQTNTSALQGTIGATQMSNTITYGINISGTVGGYSLTQSLGSSSNVQFGSVGVGTAASGVTGEIRATNNITAYYSDGRLKTITSTIENPLDKIQQISGVYYTGNDVAESYGYMDKSEQVGVIAQEIQKVLPHVVKPAPFDTAYDENGNMYSKSGENYLTVQYDKIVPLLIEAIKELKSEIDVLKGNNK